MAVQNTQAKPPVRPSAKVKQDQSIMGTNNSSIVSKRSVERLYYKRPHFFQHFVKKPQRRSPLINRGYWLRMYAIEHVVKRFLAEPSSKQKVVMNLGCGYDPLPFQYLAKEEQLCKDAIFVDIDYPELMHKKVEVIKSTEELKSLIEPIDDRSADRGLLLRSKTYLAIGCDLARVQDLNAVLDSVLEVSECMLLCTAEVSVTYMDVQAADRVIEWASAFKNMRFCLLEQHFPQRSNHPFAKKMIQHFNNLHTPLKSIVKYPTLTDQQARFRNLGWPSVDIVSLARVWSDLTRDSPETIRHLDETEPFDEWEELILFAAHYFLLVADTDPSIRTSATTSDVSAASINGDSGNFTESNIIQFDLREDSTSDKPMVHRRFGGLVCAAEQQLSFFGGHGTQGRELSIDAFNYTLQQRDTQGRQEVQSSSHAICTMPSSFEARMCHSTIRLSDAQWFVAGGRGSPDRPLRDCWLYEKGAWSRIHDLPMPLYRHSTVRVMFGETGDIGVLLYGGKGTVSVVSNAWYLWLPTCGWKAVASDSGENMAVFGASLTSAGSQKGLLLGGMSQHGVINNCIYSWSLTGSPDSPSIEVMDATSHITGSTVSCARFGAQIIPFRQGSLILGGVGRDLPERPDEAYYICTDTGKRHIQSINLRPSDDRPLLIGHSAVLVHDQVVIMGGGAVCFSFGTFWNENPLIMSDTEERKVFSLHRVQAPRTQQADMANMQARGHVRVKFARKMHHDPIQNAPNVENIVIAQASDFELAIRQSRPFIMQGMSLGDCTSQWTAKYLKSRVGVDREVVVHQASENHMDFLAKNFAYRKKSFGDFVDGITTGSREYLRSLSSEKPSSEAANLARNYPELSNDFILPAALQMVKDQMHSSVLRMSGRVRMWLHYDVMANVLCQIRSSKELLLFPPSDVSHLLIPAGASSSSIDCFDAGAVHDHPSLGLTRPYRAVLKPGDILFIPPLWLHTANPRVVDTDVNVSVNVFFRDLASTCYAAGSDVYGNRDLAAYERGRHSIHTLIQSMRPPTIPAPMSRFYLERLALELQQAALDVCPSSTPSYD